MSNEAHTALDKLHADELEKFFADLAQLERNATPAPWTLDGKTPVVPLTPEIADRFGVDIDDRPLSLLGLSVEGLAQFAEGPDAKFILVLRNCAKSLIQQCRNTAPALLDLDAVNEALGTGDGRSAAEQVRQLLEWKAEVCYALQLSQDGKDLSFGFSAAGLRNFIVQRLAEREQYREALQQIATQFPNDTPEEPNGVAREQCERAKQALRPPVV